MKASALAEASVQARVRTCQRIIGYTFSNPSLIREALTPSADHNQRLAIVGDRAADLHLAARWYHHKGRLTPSQWNDVKHELLGNASLANVALRLRINACTLTPCRGRHMATTVEAIVGAVWLDSKRDHAALGSVMDRCGLTRHALLSPPTLSAIRSGRPLSNRFFIGHHLGLLQLLFSHGKSFMVQPATGTHSDQSLHAQQKDQGAERLPTGTRSSLEHIAPHPMVDTAQKSVPARAGARDEDCGQKPSPCESTKLTEQHPLKSVLAKSELALAANTQTNKGHCGSTLDSALPVQQPAVQSDRGDSLVGGHDESTSKDTEWERINLFIWALKNHPGGGRAKRRLIARLMAHRGVMKTLPDRSLKNIPDGSSIDGIYLTTHSRDGPYDKALSLQIGPLNRKLQRLKSRSRERPLQATEVSLRGRLLGKLTKLCIERLELWLPTPREQASQIPTSVPNLGPTSASSSESPSSALPATAAVDSARPFVASTSEDQPSQTPASASRTTNVAVDWKHYLKKPTVENGVETNELCSSKPTRSSNADHLGRRSRSTTADSLD